MTTNKKKIGILALTVTAMLAWGLPTVARGDDATSKVIPKTKYYLPPGAASSATPGHQGYFYPGPVPRVRLGFYGHFDWHRGMVVDSVVPGSRANRLGLEAGDAVVEINGRPIDSAFAYHQALQASQGFGRMVVRDVRTGWNISVSLTPDYYYYSGSTPLAKLPAK